MADGEALPAARLRWSDELCRIFGQPLGFSPTLEEFIALVHPDDRRALVTTVELAKASEFGDSEYRIIRPDGEVRHVHTRRFGRFGPDGRVTHLWGTTQDVTDRIKTEDELRRARVHAEAIITAMGEGYALTVDGKVVAVNDALCRLTGFTREQLTGVGMPFPFWPTDQHAESFAIRDRIVDDGGGTFEILLMRADGTRFDAEITAQAAHNPDGSLLGFVNTVRDISEHKRHQAELERERRDLREAQAVARVGSWDYDLDDTCPGRWSLELYRLLGLDSGTAAPSLPEFLTMVHPEDRARIERQIERAIKDGKPVGAEFTVIRADGSEIFVAFRAEINLDDRARALSMFGTLQDITERAQRDQEQAALREIAELVADGADPSEVFSSAAKHVRDLFRSYSGVVAQFDEDNRRSVLVSGWTADDERLSGRTFPLEGLAGGALATVYATGEPAVHDGSWSPQRSGAVAAPIIVKGRLWGALGASFTVCTPAVGAEQRLARFADLVAMAIANADAWDALARKAATDSVTGLANHRTFHDRLRSEVKRARRYSRDLSLVLLDLDHFKRINDIHGHQAGDQALAEFARRLSGEARDGELIARIGGEEFAWLMPEADGRAAYKAAERIRRVIEREPFPHVGTITVSAGVCATEPGMDTEDLIRGADRALYWAKDGGRNTTFLYSDEAHTLLTTETSTAQRFQAMSSVRALARAIDSKDQSTREHSERVAALAEQLALTLGWTAKRARLLHDCGLLHDVGKIGIRDEILFKPGPLTADEHDQLKHHAEIGALIASEVLEHEQVTWIRAHHERWDGGGYPDGIAGDQIPDGAQLLAIADAYDAITEIHTYKQPRSSAEALAECQAESGRQFAPAAVLALLEIFARREISAAL